MKNNPLQYFYSLFPLQQITAFLGVGLVATSIHYIIMIFMVEILYIPPIKASLAGYIAGGITSYILNYKFTYETTREHKQSIWRFFLVAFAGFCMTWLMMDFLINQFMLPYILSQAITTGIILFWSFLLHKFWSFGEPAK